MAAPDHHHRPARLPAVSAVVRLAVLLLLGLPSSPWVPKAGAAAAETRAPASPASDPRAVLVRALVSDDASEQLALIRSLADLPPMGIEPILVAWRLGNVYLFDGPENSKIPFTLEAATDSDGRARGLKVLDGAALTDADGKPVFFAPADVTAAETTAKLRKAIKTTLDLFTLANPNPKVRRDAVIKLGQERNAEYLPFLQARQPKEQDADVRRALDEAVALTGTSSVDPAIRVASIQRLGELRSVNSLSFLQDLQKDLAKKPAPPGDGTLAAVRDAVREIEAYQWRGNLIGTAFRGLSLAAVLLVAALGLAITFGLMGVINMAHGELMMVGAYTTYVVQNVFKSAFGSAGVGYEVYFIAALAASFVVASLVGLLLERGIIRFLYRRPLESLLATWGVSLLLQQTFRHIFGAANVQVGSPSWLSGSLVLQDVLFAYNRLFVIAFAALIVVATWALLTRTPVGLQIRAVMQNRTMAAALGVRTDRVNMFTFAYGSGLAGMAGACLSQIGNVGPSLGQNHIVDCFMIVVLGGIGNLVGTVSASLGVGVTDQILQPWLGAVMGKITVLAAIILFLQWRPAGLFATRGRGLEG